MSKQEEQMIRQYKVKYLEYLPMQTGELKQQIREAILDFANDGYGFYDEKCEYADNLISTVGAIADYGFCKVGINPDKYVLINKIISIEAYGDTSFKKPEIAVKKEQTKSPDGSKRQRRQFYKFPNDKEVKETESTSNTSTFAVTDCGMDDKEST